MHDTRSHTIRGAVALAGAGIPDAATHPLDLDPVDVFAQLVREVDAGRALVSMTPAGDQRRAALDALALARDVLDDARQLLDDPADPQLLSERLGLPASFRR